MSEDVQVRRQVAAEHGLNWPEAKFLTDDTIPELEKSAARLADLLGKQRPPEQPQRPPSLFEIAAAEKAEAKKALVNALRGRPQRRDERGAGTRDQPLTSPVALDSQFRFHLRATSRPSPASCGPARATSAQTSDGATIPAPGR